MIIQSKDLFEILNSRQPTLLTCINNQNERLLLHPIIQISSTTSGFSKAEMIIFPFQLQALLGDTNQLTQKIPIIYLISNLDTIKLIPQTFLLNILDPYFGLSGFKIIQDQKKKSEHHFIKQPKSFDQRIFRYHYFDHKYIYQMNQMNELNQDEIHQINIQLYFDNDHR